MGLSLKHSNKIQRFLSMFKRILQVSLNSGSLIQLNIIFKRLAEEILKEKSQSSDENSQEVFLIEIFISGGDSYLLFNFISKSEYFCHHQKGGDC